MLGAKLYVDPINFSTAYNFGPHSVDVLTVESMVESEIKIYGSGDFEIIEQANQSHEAGLLKLDISKANDELNWKPILNANNAIE